MAIRRRGYDRQRLLEQAARARQKGRRKKAIQLYERVLEAEPRSAELHRRVAPLLAQTNKRAEALRSYGLAVQGLVEKGFNDRAIGLYREALRYLPQEVELWEALAVLQVEQKRPVDAVHSLLEGRRHFRSRRVRSQAIRLLRKVHELDPRSFKPILDLARLLAKSGRRKEALNILRRAERSNPAALRRLRAAQFQLSATPRTAWLWLRALFAGH